MSNVYDFSAQLGNMSLGPRPRYSGAAGLTAQNSYNTLPEQFDRMRFGGRKSESSRTIRRRSRSRARFSRRKRANRK